MFTFTEDVLDFAIEAASQQIPCTISDKKFLIAADGHTKHLVDTANGYLITNRGFYAKEYLCKAGYHYLNHRNKALTAKSLLQISKEFKDNVCVRCLKATEVNFSHWRVFFNSIFKLRVSIPALAAASSNAASLEELVDANYAAKTAYQFLSAGLETFTGVDSSFAASFSAKKELVDCWIACKNKVLDFDNLLNRMVFKQWSSDSLNSLAEKVPAEYKDLVTSIFSHCADFILQNSVDPFAYNTELAIDTFENIILEYFYPKDAARIPSIALVPAVPVFSFKDYSSFSDWVLAEAHVAAELYLKNQLASWQAALNNWKAGTKGKKVLVAWKNFMEDYFSTGSAIQPNFYPETISMFPNSEWIIFSIPKYVESFFLDYIKAQGHTEAGVLGDDTSFINPEVLAVAASLLETTPINLALETALLSLKEDF